MTKDNFFVLTGGPGMGKTSVIAALQEQGYLTVSESGREIIRQQVATGGTALPWQDQQAFARLMFDQAIEDFEQLSAQTTPVFFDRGIADTIGYLELCGLPVPDFMRQAARRYRCNNRIFITPPWKQIYTGDTERKQSFEEATATYEVMVKVYQQLDYTLVHLPLDTVAARVAFLLLEATPKD
ncbi:putative ATPase [Chitinophaga polysaccharea]|uniref:Putative ATPase n=1 Tax=Chitinophaga polysaccharea TaxID=1293035 RepID=A0A561PRJ4_9BACT|nr:AAA family ATPase [Chitinophaga polysaccharea]TWF40742.1 putative ATPase [Chitinophaga polysaccharea]